MSDEVLTTQRDALRESKARRDEATALLAEAHERVAQARQEARTLLEQARGEADDLLAARDRAADELARLSDVITVLSGHDTDHSGNEEQPPA